MIAVMIAVEQNSKAKERKLSRKNSGGPGRTRTCNQTVMSVFLWRGGQAKQGILAAFVASRHDLFRRLIVVMIAVSLPSPSSIGGGR